MLFGKVIVMAGLEGYFVISLPVSISGPQAIGEIGEIRSYEGRV
jgi:hypothetical protein